MSASEIRDNQKVVQKGRRQPLEGVEVPLRDRIVEKLFQKLEERNIGQYVVDQWEKGNAHRNTWLTRQEEYLSQWDEHLVSDTEGPFAGSSQLHIPITFIVSKALHARYMQALWQDPPFHTKAGKASAVDRVPVVQDVMRYALLRWSNYHKGADAAVDSWVWKWITQGSATLKLRWDVRYSRFIDVRPTRKPGPPVVSIVDGREVTAPGPVIEGEEEFANVKECFNGPVFETVNAEDLLLIGGGGDPDVADEVTHRSFLTASELWTLADRKVFKNAAVKEVIEGGRNYKAGATGNEIKEVRAVNAGQAATDNEAEHDRYEILESYIRVDVDDSGIDSDVIVWVHKKSKRLLRATYLYRVSKTGKRPFKKADFHLRDGQEYGVGIPELMYPLQMEIDAMHNMRIDCGLVSTMPFGFYRATSSLDPKTIRYEPGTLIPVDNPQTDVYFPQMGNRTTFGFQEEAALDSLIQRLTGINELAMGMLSSQGATRTATGARVLANEVSSNLDIHLKRINRAWKGALEYVFEMLQMRMPRGLSFRITGEEGQEVFREGLNPEDIHGSYEFEVSPNSSSSNQQVQQEIASQTLGLVSNPLAIQLGIVGPAQFYEAMKNVLQSFGVKDYHRFVQKPQGYQYQLTPVQEVDALASGFDVPVPPNADHEGFLTFWEYFKQHDELLGRLNEEQTMRIEAQARKHAQMQEALQAVAAQNANAQQMRTNAAMSQQQAPAGLNPAEGSAAPVPA